MINFYSNTLRVTITNVKDPEDVKVFIHHPSGVSSKTNFARSILSTMGKSILWCYVRSKSTPAKRSIAIPLTGEYSYLVGDGTNEGVLYYIADIIKYIKPEKSEFVIEPAAGRDQYVLTMEIIPTASETTILEDTSLDHMRTMVDAPQSTIRTEFFGD